MWRERSKSKGDIIRKRKEKNEKELSELNLAERSIGKINP